MIEELKGRLAKYPDITPDEKFCFEFSRAELTALIAAMELAEAALKADLLLNGGLPFVGTPAEDRFFEALDAYDAAKKEAK